MEERAKSPVAEPPAGFGPTIPRNILDLDDRR